MTTSDPAIALKNSHREFGEFGGVNPSICTSTTFTTMDPLTMFEIFTGEKGTGDGCYLYSRHFNPNNLQLGMRLAAMEGLETGYPTASGMAAIMITLLQLLKPGDELVASSSVYGGTHARFENFFPKWGIKVNLIHPADTKGFEEAITDKTKVIYTEVAANPTMDVADIEALSKIAHDNNCTFVVDNTFTPLTFTPSKFGADIVIYSTTKFINGRSDSIGGAVCCSQDFLLKLMDLHEGELMLMGPVMDSRCAHQLNVYLTDLPIRIKAHSERALEFAKRLESKGVKVRYPGLASHPQHEVAAKMLNEKYGYGGMMAIELDSIEESRRFVKKLQDLGGGLNAVSLGYSDTLVSISGETTSSEVDAEKQVKIGLSPGLIRASIDYTGELESEWAKMEEALDFARA